MTAQETAVSVLVQAQNQENMLQAQTQENALPPPAVQDPAAVQVEAPTPSTYSPQKPREDVEVLMRGPLHEAFANVHQTNPVAGPVMEQRPPEPIEELLPEYKPDGENIKWITGYWSLDDETSQFIWVSGLWREVPPGQRWIPGYWEEANPGYRWVSGFWTAAATEELSYLPAPPESLEQGPSSAAPSENYFYSPGNWVYQSQSYQWQPGYWQPNIENWVWIPSRYVWTPGGYVYCAGYWDRLFQDRGVCFAPVRFIQPAYYRPQFYYRPVCRILTDVSIFAHLFVRPSYGHYYFGDWYDDHYSGRGYCAWVDYPSRYRGYDSLYNYYHYGHTPYRNTTFIHWAETQHRHCQDNADYRPKHTYHADYDRNYDRGDDRNYDRGIDGRHVSSDHRVHLVEDLNRHVRQSENEKNGETLAGRVRFHRVDENDRKMARESAVPIRDLQAARHKVETSRSVKTASLNRQSKVDVSNGRVNAAKSEIKLALPKSKDADRVVSNAPSRPDKAATDFAGKKRFHPSESKELNNLPKKNEPSVDARPVRRAGAANAERSNEAKDRAKTGDSNQGRHVGAQLENGSTSSGLPQLPPVLKKSNADIKPPKSTESKSNPRLGGPTQTEKLPRPNSVERNRNNEAPAPRDLRSSNVPRKAPEKISPSNTPPKINLESGNRNQVAPNRNDRSGDSKRGWNQNKGQASPPQVQSEKQVLSNPPRSKPAPTITRIEKTIPKQNPVRQNQSQQQFTRQPPKVESQKPSVRQAPNQPKIERRAPEVRQQSSKPSNPSASSNRNSAATNSNRNSAPTNRGSESKRGGEKSKKN